MKGLGYVFLIFLVVGIWIIWQIVRRASAGAQAMINPERYAIQKVEEMQQDLLVARLLSEPPESTSYPKDKWYALVKYDAEISAAAEELRPYGDAWIDKLGKAYFDLQEDRSYLRNIVRKLSEEAENEVAQVAAQRGARNFSWTADGEPCTDESRKILRQAKKLGYVLTVDDQKTIAATKVGRGTTYLRSNSDIKQFGRFL
jgi:hypothetical protein